MTEIEQVTDFPPYDSFRSSISKKTTHDSFNKHMNKIMEVENTRGRYSLRDLFEFIGLDTDGFSEFDLVHNKLPDDSETLTKIENLLHTSPIKYFNSKTDYLTKTKNGTYRNLLDYFKVYNQVDVDILLDGWTNLAKSFWKMFGENILMSWSLPGVAQNILVSKYDRDSPPVYTFSDKYGFLNKEVRRNICGGFSGPITRRYYPMFVYIFLYLYFRHVELDASNQIYDDSVYFNPDGEKYTEISQYDANSLYPTCMLDEMPTGLGVYLRKDDNGLNPELLADGQLYPRFSNISLEYLDMIQGKGRNFTDWIFYRKNIRKFNPK